jgi:hypothetical protein
MRTEIKVLIVAFILMFSVGPLSFFLSGTPEQIDIPEPNGEPISYTLAGNFSGTIIEVDPYITYVGVSTSSNINALNKTIQAIDDIENYTIDMHLNPSGNGYQYIINVLINDTTQIPKIGFRLAFRLNDYFFESQNSLLPVTSATILMPEEFTVATSSGMKTVEVGENKTMKAPLLYNHQRGDVVTLVCPQFVTTTNYHFLRIAQSCIDNEFNNEQPYVGLTAAEVMLARKSKKLVEVDIENFQTVYFEGAFPYGIDINEQLIEETVETSDASVQQPLPKLTLYDIDALSFSLEGATFDVVDETTVDVYFADLDAVLDEIEQTLGELPEYEVAEGSFIVELYYASEAATRTAKDQLLSISGLTLTRTYKAYIYELPPTILLEKTYDTYRIKRVPLHFALSTLPGKRKIMLNVTTFYDEILDIQATEF